MLRKSVFSTVRVPPRNHPSMQSKDEDAWNAGLRVEEAGWDAGLRTPLEDAA